MVEVQRRFCVYVCVRSTKQRERERESIMLSDEYFQLVNKLQGVGLNTN